MDEQLAGIVERLEKTQIGERGSYAAGEEDRLLTELRGLKDRLHQLKDAALDETPESLELRERAAKAIRKIALRFWNDFNHFVKSLALIEDAISVCPPSEMASKLDEDRNQIKKSIDELSTHWKDIPLPGEQIFSFTQNYVEYNNTRFDYRDIAEIAYYGVNTAMNGIPSAQVYEFKAATDARDVMKLSMKSIFMIGNKKKREAWMKIARTTSVLIVPHVAQRLVHQLFNENKTLKMGGLTMTKDGYTKRKLFGNPETIAWKETQYIPTFSRGWVYLWKKKKEKPAQFASINCATPNAVVLPELFRRCICR